VAAAPPSWGRHPQTFTKAEVEGHLQVQPFSRAYRRSVDGRSPAFGLEPRFTCSVCGKRGADVRPDFNWKGAPKAMTGFR